MDACCAWDCDPRNFMAKFSPTLNSRTTLYNWFVQKYITLQQAYYQTISSCDDNTVAVIYTYNNDHYQKQCLTLLLSACVSMNHFSNIYWECSDWVIVGLYWDEMVAFNWRWLSSWHLHILFLQDLFNVILPPIPGPYRFPDQNSVYFPLSPQLCYVSITTFESFCCMIFFSS